MLYVIGFFPSETECVARGVLQMSHLFTLRFVHRISLQQSNATRTTLAKIVCGVHCAVYLNLARVEITVRSYPVDVVRNASIDTRLHRRCALLAVRNNAGNGESTSVRDVLLDVQAAAAVPVANVALSSKVTAAQLHCPVLDDGRRDVGAVVIRIDGEIHFLQQE